MCKVPSRERLLWYFLLPFQSGLSQLHPQLCCWTRLSVHHLLSYCGGQQRCVVLLLPEAHTAPWLQEKLPVAKLGNIAVRQHIYAPQAP